MDAQTKQTIEDLNGLRRMFVDSTEVLQRRIRENEEAVVRIDRQIAMLYRNSRPRLAEKCRAAEAITQWLRSMIQAPQPT